MIGIINYGLGNVGAFLNMYRRMGVAATVVENPAELEGVTHVIVPGVGAFDHAMTLLNASGMREPLEKLVERGDVPVLGVCVGMQMLAARSEEGELPGLGWIEGEVLAFRSDPAFGALPTPHMGWNDVEGLTCAELFKGTAGDARFYFLHSYYFQCDEAYVGARTRYGLEFPCVVHDGKVFGVQFHPEKSHHWGATLLRNFGEI